MSPLHVKTNISRNIFSYKNSGIYFCSQVIIFSIAITTWVKSIRLYYSYVAVSYLSRLPYVKLYYAKRNLTALNITSHDL